MRRDGTVGALLCEDRVCIIADLCSGLSVCGAGWLAMGSNAFVRGEELVADALVLHGNTTDLLWNWKKCVLVATAAGGANLAIAIEGL